MPKRNIHVIFVSEDGVAALVCGVGSVTRHFIAGFPDLAARVRDELGVGMRLSVISHRLNDGAVGIRPDLLAASAETCRRFGGELRLLAADRKNGDEYFNFGQWRGYDDEASAAVDSLTDGTELTVVLAHDSIFGRVRGTGKHVVNVWVPHSLVAVHGQSYVDADERGKWEREIAERIISDPQSFVGCISPYVRTILRETFPDGKLLSFRNGFHLPTLREWVRPAPEIRETLLGRGIPVDKEVVFSFGRADEYKGLAVALESMQRFVAGRPSCHGVMVASRFSDEKFIEAVQGRLKGLAAKGPANVSLFLGYEFDLPKLLMQWPKTRFLLHLPTRDFAPLVPHEADLLGHEELLVLNSDIPCLRADIQDGVDGFLVPPRVSDVARRLEELSGLSGRDRAAMHSRAKRRAEKSCDIVENYFAGLKMIVDRHP